MHVPAHLPAVTAVPAPTWAFSRAMAGLAAVMLVYTVAAYRATAQQRPLPRGPTLPGTVGAGCSAPLLLPAAAAAGAALPRAAAVTAAAAAVGSEGAAEAIARLERIQVGRALEEGWEAAARGEGGAREGAKEQGRGAACRVAAGVRPPTWRSKVAGRMAADSVIP